MPKFFVPGAKGDQEAEQIRDGAIAGLRAQGLAPIPASRVFRLAYVHDGKNYLAEVGKQDPSEGIIVLIFEGQGRELYFVCTPNRGVLRGSPILVGHSNVTRVEEFSQ